MEGHYTQSIIKLHDFETQSIITPIEFNFVPTKRNGKRNVIVNGHRFSLDESVFRQDGRGGINPESRYYATSAPANFTTSHSCDWFLVPAGRCNVSHYPSQSQPPDCRVPGSSYHHYPSPDSCWRVPRQKLWPNTIGFLVLELAEGYCCCWWSLHLPRLPPSCYWAGGNDHEPHPYEECLSLGTEEGYSLHQS